MRLQATFGGLFPDVAGDDVELWACSTSDAAGERLILNVIVSTMSDTAKTVLVEKMICPGTVMAPELVVTELVSVGW